MRILYTFRPFCECETSFSYVNTGETSYLDVGVLEATNCDFDSYVIDWLNLDTGNTRVSSNSGGTGIDFVHPIFEPVEGGTWLPQIRYVVISGITYYANVESCTLSGITIEPYTCSSGGTGKYSQTVVYNNTTQPAEEASRTIRIDLAEIDADIAWYFFPEAVCDRIQWIYVSSGTTGTTFVDWVVGTRYNTNDDSSIPRLFNMSNLDAITSLDNYFTYSPGDYIIIDILPGYYEPENTNTDWTFSYKCFSTSDRFSCESFLDGVNDPISSSFVLTPDSGTCRNYVTYNTLTGYTSIDDINAYDAYYYLSDSVWTGQAGTNDWYTDSREMYLRYDKAGTYYWDPGGSTNCTDLNSGLTITKTGTTLTYQFSDIDDYNIYYDGYNRIITATNFNNYTSDNTDINHYKFFRFYERISLNLCGDAASTIYHHVHFSSNFTWNVGSLLLTINLSGLTNGLQSGLTCDTTYDVVQARIDQANDLLVAADYVYETKQGELNGPRANAYFTQSYAQETYTFLRYSRISPRTFDSYCSLEDEWNLYGDPLTYNQYYQFYWYYLRVDITDMDDPSNNFVVFNKLSGTTGEVNPFWTCVYQISGGTEVPCDDEIYKFIFKINVPSAQTVTTPLNYIDADVDWGDGSAVERVTTDYQTHYYDAGIYEISVHGTARFNARNQPSFAPLVTEVVNWGAGVLGSIDFEGCINLTILPDAPIDGSTTSMSFGRLFKDCVSLTSIPSSIFDKMVNSTYFYAAFQGCRSLTSIPSGLFKNNSKVTTAHYLFQYCSALTTVPSDLFSYFTDGSTLNLSYTFSYCSGLTSIPSGLFDNNTNLTNIQALFDRCTSLPTVPSGLFDNNVNIITMSNLFYNCTSLSSVPSDLFRYLTGVTSLQQVFAYCTSLPSVPTDIFRYNTNVTNVSGLFLYSSLSATTVDMFRYNTLIDSFYQVFYYCSSLTEVSTDLFRYNTSATNMAYMFYQCSSLESVPTDLFKYNINASDFRYSFYQCSDLQLNRNIFFADGEESTRFLNKSVDFSYCLNRTTFTGTQGEAPALWDCSFGTGTPTKTRCYGGSGNSTTSLSNYGDIPSDWIL